MKAEEVANQIGEQYRHGHGYVRIPCYNASFHKNEDKDPSLVIYDGDRGYYCFACGQSGSHEWLLRQYGITAKTKRSNTVVAEKEYKYYDFKAIYPKLEKLPEKARKAMEAKGFDPDQLERRGWRWHTNQIAGWGTGIFIPYKKKGNIVSARLRLLNGPIRFKSLPGGESFPYMMDNAEGRFYVCEGESDTMTISMVGYKAIGIPGATNTQAIRKMVNAAAKTGATPCVIPDNDKAGQDFASRVRKFCQEAGIGMSIQKVPHGKDVNEWYNLVGEEKFLEELTLGKKTKII